MSIIRRSGFAFPRQSSPRQFPQWPVELDPDHPLNDALVGWWPLTTGGADISGNGSNLINFNATGGTIEMTSGPLGPAMFMTGNAVGGAYQGSYLILTTPSPLVNVVGAFTVAAWVMPAASGSNGVGDIIIYGSTAAYGLGMGLTSTSTVNIAVNASILTPTLSTPWVSGAWQHLAVIVNGTDALVYLNGALVATLASALLPTGTSGLPMCIGGQGNGNVSFNGSISDARLWARVLSASEVFSVYSNPVAPLRPVVRRLLFPQQVLLPTGVASTTALGAPIFSLNTVGVGGATAPGVPVFESTLSPAGIADAGALGEPGLRPDIDAIYAAALINVAVLGAPRAALGATPASGLRTAKAGGHRTAQV